jgi:hypothetical protein
MLIFGVYLRSHPFALTLVSSLTFIFLCHICERYCDRLMQRLQEHKWLSSNIVTVAHQGCPQDAAPVIDRGTLLIVSHCILSALTTRVSVILPSDNDIRAALLGQFFRVTAPRRACLSASPISLSSPRLLNLAELEALDCYTDVQGILALV